MGFKGASQFKPQQGTHPQLLVYDCTKLQTLKLGAIFLLKLGINLT